MEESCPLSLEDHLINLAQMPVVGDRGMHYRSVSCLFDQNKVLIYGYDRNTRSLLVAVDKETNPTMQTEDLLIAVPEFPQLITREMRADGFDESKIQMLYLDLEMMTQLKDFIVDPSRIQAHEDRKKQLQRIEDGIYDFNSEANRIIDSIITYAVKMVQVISILKQRALNLGQG